MDYDFGEEKTQIKKDPWPDPSPLRSSDSSAISVALLVLSGIVGLVALGSLSWFTLESRRTGMLFQARGRSQTVESAGGSNSVRAPQPVTRSGERALVPCRLAGPGGTISLPRSERTIVNVFLQRCGDCMPAFEAYKKLGGVEDLGPVVNVAYGAADEAWLQSYGLGDNLVIDPGDKLVRSLGITSFTTLVVDPDGTVLQRISPAATNYREALAAAFQSGAIDSQDD